MAKRPTKTILVTGGAGFIGSAYLNIMAPRYPAYRYIVVDALTSVADKKNILVLGLSNVQFIKCDIRKEKALGAVFKKYHPTHVVHFAAETHVDNSIRTPHVFVETNVVGTHNLLLLARVHKVERFHHISTDEVYGSLSLTDAPSTEEDLLLPNSPYSASKAAADHLVRAYEKTFGLDVVITRCSNNYGPGQDLTKFIPLFISRLLVGKKVPLYGGGENVRDWIYVDDHVEAIDAVFHRGKSGEIYNISGSCELANIDVVSMLLQKTGHDKSMIERVADRPGHDFRYALNDRKVQKLLGWKPRVSFSEGIERTVQYYRDRLTTGRPKRR